MAQACSTEKLVRHVRGYLVGSVITIFVPVANQSYSLGLGL